MSILPLIISSNFSTSEAQVETQLYESGHTEKQYRNIKAAKQYLRNPLQISF